MNDHPTPVDLRSDTVTLPSQGMRRVMAGALVGDDQFGEDPTTNELQDRVADPAWHGRCTPDAERNNGQSGCIAHLTRPGDDVIVSRESHAVWHETGASVANAGVQFSEIGCRGIFSADEFQAAVKPRGHVIYPPTTLVEIENTHNRAGGVISPQEEAVRICAAARTLTIGTYLDGARIWNSAVTSGQTVADLAAPFDLVSVAFSKGLGAPGGSVLAGTSDLIQAAVRYRRVAPCARSGFLRRLRYTHWNTTWRAWLRIT